MIKMKFGLFLIMLAFASEKENEFESAKSEKRERNTDDLILVKIEEEEYSKVPKKTSSIYFGVSYNKRDKVWHASRHSKKEKKMVHNGRCKDEETAAHASDTLARKLIANGEQNHRLNFLNDITEVYAEKKSNSSSYIGVTCNRRGKTWEAFRHSRVENKKVYNGRYKDEETAAHASDTLARNLMENGEHNHKLNFPNEITEVHPEISTSSIYIGVSYNKRYKTWCASRHSKDENKMVNNGCYKDEETAAHASDTLARKLIENGEQNHKLNFPNDINEEFHRRYKRKRSEHNNLGYSENK